MKVLFILEDYIICPLGIAYLSSYLKMCGHAIDLVNFDVENLKDKLSSYRPDILAYSITTGRHVKFREVNQEARRYCRDELGYKPFSLFGGPHCTFYPDFVDTCDEIDAICKGEGFIPFKELLNRLSENKGIEGIPNIYITGTDTPTLAPIEDKDNIPFPDRELIYKYSKNKQNPIRSIIASFECGLHCRYCYAPQYRKIYGLGKGFKMINSRSPLRVCEEADEVVANWHTDLFYFQDDIFPVWQKNFINSFVEHWGGYNFHIQIRAEMIHDPLIKRLKSVGLHGVTFAVESGVERIRKEILDRKMSNKQIINAANILRDNGIKFRIENMMGVMGETFADALTTLDLNIKCNPDLAWASLWQPYPGTSLGDEAIAKGLFNPKSDNIGFDFFHDTILVGKESLLISNLQKLFGVTTCFPWIRPFIPMLCRLPKNRVYNFVYAKFKQWTYESRLYKVKPHLRGSKQMAEVVS